MAGNFDIRPSRAVGENDIAKTQIALIVLGQNINEAARINVNQIAQKAQEFLSQEAPRGDTGNLKRSFVSSEVGSRAQAEAGGFLPGNQFEARAYINPLKSTTYSEHTSKNGGIWKQRNDPPAVYALAINNGRKALNGRFIWDRGHPSEWSGKSQGTKWVARNLSPRLGNDFIGRAQVLTDAYATEKARTFFSYVRNNNPKTNIRRKEDLGFPGF